MGIYKLIRQQYIQADIDTVWLFFSNPANLAKITPPDMRFKTTSGPVSGEIYPGQIITYKVSPLFGIPLSWMTEITEVVKNELFVDEQKRGPYKLWQHKHYFEQKGSGVLMTDIVQYELPFFLLGRLAHTLFIKRRLAHIFDYRHRQVEQLFN